MNQEKIKQGKVKLYHELSKFIITMELNQRGVKGWFSNSSKDKLQQLLEVEMHGIQRLPSLMHNTPFKSLKELNRNNYKI